MVKDKLGMKVAIDNNKFQIYFSNDDELEKLLNLLKIKIDE
jgi:hypothetical protein